MRRIVHRLSGNRGATLVMALIFFLVAMTVGVVVLTATYTANGKLSTIRKTEQDYLAVSSAAKMIRDGLDGKDSNSDNFAVLNNVLPGIIAQCFVQNPVDLTPSVNFDVDAQNTGVTVHGSATVSIVDKELTIRLWLGETENAYYNKVFLKFKIDDVLKFNNMGIQKGG